MQVRVVQHRQIKGWGFSLILHGILLSAVLPIFRLLPAPIHQEPFQWNVTFVESPQQNSLVEPTSDTSSANELLQTSDAIERPQVRPIGDPSSPISQETSDINETIQVAKNVSSNIADPTPPVVAPAQAEVAPQTISTTEAAPVVQETVPEQRNRIERPQAMMATPPVTAEPPPAIAPSTEQEILPPRTQSLADMAMAPVQSHEPLQVPPISAPPIASGQPSAPQADYGWLQRAVSRRLEELKRSSQPSLENSSRLKVLVRAVVSGRGDLMEAEVVKSSGLERIDREAMTLVQRAFPMVLDQTLDRPQIVMRIPITYSRD